VRSLQVGGEKEGVMSPSRTKFMHVQRVQLLRCRKRKLIYQNRKPSLLFLDIFDFQIWKVASGLIGSQSSASKPLGTTFLRVESKVKRLDNFKLKPYPSARRLGREVRRAR
jgi:hypothetical protein